MSRISKSNLSKEIIKDFGEGYYINRRILWNKIFNFNLFSEELIDKYKDVMPWGVFVVTQPMNSEQINRYGGVYINWEYILYNQILSKDEIIKFIGRVDVKDIPLCQHLDLELINEIERYDPSLVYNDLWNRSLLNCQILSEEFLLKNLNRFKPIDILYTQRINMRIKKALGIYRIGEDIYRENYLYRTDLGKDWFIGYAKKCGSRFNRTYYLLNSSLGTLIHYNERCLFKIRIYYKDCITKFKYSKVDIISEIEKLSVKRV